MQTSVQIRYSLAFKRQMVAAVSFASPVALLCSGTKEASSGDSAARLGLFNHMKGWGAVFRGCGYSRAIKPRRSGFGLELRGRNDKN